VTAPHVLELALVCVLGSAAQSATGFGVALPLSPVAFALMSPADAVLTVAAGSLMQNLLVLGTRRRRLAIRKGDAAVLIALAIPGLLIGAVVVSHASKPPMQLAVGVAILAAVLFRVHEPGRVRGIVSREAGGVIGLLGGFLTTTVGINGPPLVMWLRARDATFTELRDTLAALFLILNVAAIPSLATRGGTIPAVLVPALAAGLAVGHVLGLQAHDRLSTRALDRVLVAILTGAAVASIVGAATALV
jgi:uncharacterized membrane protein YfcA